jgi:hypothetical protein
MILLQDIIFINTLLNIKFMHFMVTIAVISYSNIPLLRIVRYDMLIILA